MAGTDGCIISRDEARRIYKFDIEDNGFEKFFLGLVHMMNGETQEAMCDFSNAMTSGSNNPYICRFLVVAMIDNGDNIRDIKSVVDLWSERVKSSGIADNEHDLIELTRDIIGIVERGSCNLDGTVRDCIKKYVTDGFKKVDNKNMVTTDASKE